MSEVTRVLSAIEQGDPHAAEQLLPLVYQELRQLAAQKLAQEKPGQTLEATALVHEAYLRLVDVDKAQHWNSRGHFFAAAAEAMRRILVEGARRKQSQKHGGQRRRVDLDQAEAVAAALPSPQSGRIGTMPVPRRAEFRPTGKHEENGPSEGPRKQDKWRYFPLRFCPPLNPGTLST